MTQALNGLIIEIQVGYFHLGKILELNGKAMVLRRNLNLACGKLFHRMIAAMVTKLELAGLTTQSMPDQLMAQTNACDRKACLDQFPDCCNLIAQGRRIAWAIGEKDRTRSRCPHLLDT